MTILNPFMLFAEPVTDSAVIGWEAISVAHKTCPEYLAQARLLRDQAEAEWQALTDLEPPPYTEISAALERLRRVEAEYFAARARWDREKAAG